MVAAYRPTVGLYLEKRTLLQNGKFTIKVEVIFRIRQGNKWKYIQQYRSTSVSASPEEFLLIKSRSSKGPLRDSEAKAHKSMREVEDLLDEHPTLTLAQFKTWKSGRTVGAQFRLKPLFETMIEKRTKLKTISVYKSAMISIFKYGSEDLTLSEITPEWLKGYEKWHTEIEKNSLNTAGTYLRHLRIVFNENKNLFCDDEYPFGKGKYIIRKKKTVKHTFSIDQKDGIVHLETATEAQWRAVDASLFSYYCNGMNFVDMARLKKDQFFPSFESPEYFTFIREKTKDTVDEQVEIAVYLTDKAIEILRRRGTHAPYVFGIINDRMTEEDIKREVANWLQRTNKGLRRVMRNLGQFSDHASAKWWRHLFATTLSDSGVPLPKIQDMLGHTAPETTREYLGSNVVADGKKFAQFL